ncbi:uncharacterized protein BCR38DRAFT_26127 [Pseudomassariella vexata]|uniref:Uncharacterized protein n=1 Tax=Pseudomassariella vexata TaxID=1141098 RepID=A0A1Y2EKH8_9PEZI|nr:uncharacterized protein BCR38DRAFT_26127 [Pseudomassariella vexata]ORY72038.1 hypothetical protein BCR38DRAFT_26127 [Pseudomassariella vexata]
MMASPTTEAHRLTRRDSSPRASRNSSRRRPRLLRACATEPSITTSSACKGVLASPNSSRRATELLNRVAVNNAAADSLRSSVSSTRSYGMDPGSETGHHMTEAARREMMQSNKACWSSLLARWPMSCSANSALQTRRAISAFLVPIPGKARLKGGRSHWRDRPERGNPVN